MRCCGRPPKKGGLRSRRRGGPDSHGAQAARELGVPRARCAPLYARRRVGGPPGRPGPMPPIGDQELVRLIRRVLADSPFAGEGYRKVRARLRREHGVRVSGKRVLRLLRRERLLAPQRARGRHRLRPMTARSSLTDPTSAGAPMPPWPGPGPTAGCGCSRSWTTTPPRPGRTWPRQVTASLPCSRSMTRSSTAGAASAPTSPAAWSSATTGGRSTAAWLFLDRTGTPSPIGTAGMPDDRPGCRWCGDDGPAHKSASSPVVQPVQDNVTGPCCPDQVIAPVGLARAIHLGGMQLAAERRSPLRERLDPVALLRISQPPEVLLHGHIPDATSVPGGDDAVRMGGGGGGEMRDAGGCG
jgi:hypothetical protein